MHTKTKQRLREVALALAALILIAGALALTFSHVLLSGPEDIAGRYDIYRYYAPITFYLDYCLSQGELPLWNPMVYCGLPNAANPQAFVFYPLNLIRSFLLPTISPQATNDSLVILIGLHLLFMGFCTYCLGRAHRLSFPGALVGALAWVCSALIVRRACEYHFLYTMAWLPLILLLVKWAIDSRHGRLTLVYSMLAGLLFGVSILGGFLQIVNYVGVSIGIYALVYRVTSRAPAELTGWRAKTVRMGIEGLSFSLLLVIAGLVALVLILPTLELAPYSTRDKGSTVSMYSDLMAWDITRLYKSLVVYPGTQWEPETIRTAGITGLLLAAAGCFNRRRKLVALFGLMTYGLIDCSFGPPFPIASLVNLLTPFSSSAYSRGFDFALLPLGLLGGLGVDTLLDATRRPARRNVLALVLIYVAGATLIPLWTWTHPHAFLKVTALVVFVPAAALLLMLLALWTTRWRPVVWLLACALPVLLVGETFAWNSSFVPWMIERHLKETPPPQSGHHFPTTNQRWTDPIPNRTLYSMIPAMNGVDPLHLGGMRSFVSGQFREKLNKREVRDWEPTAENTRGNLLLKRFFWLVPAYSTAAMPDKTTLFAPTEVAYLESPPPGGVREFQTHQGAFQSLSERAVRSDLASVPSLRSATGANQRHTLDFTLPVTADGAQPGSAGALQSTLVYHYTSSIPAQVDTVFVDQDNGRRQWGLRHRVDPSKLGEGVIEVPVPDMRNISAEVTVKGTGKGNFQFTDAYLMTDPADMDHAIALEKFSANHVALSISALTEPTLLLFLDAWYPGWTAQVDGTEVPILRANLEFKAIVLPPGAHKVTFTFRPMPVYVGMAASVLTAVLTLVIIFWLVVAHRRRQRFAPTEVTLAPVATGPPPEPVAKPVAATTALEEDCPFPEGNSDPSNEIPTVFLAEETVVLEEPAPVPAPLDSVAPIETNTVVTDEVAPALDEDDGPLVVRELEATEPSDKPESLSDELRPESDN